MVLQCYSAVSLWFRNIKIKDVPLSKLSTVLAEIMVKTMKTRVGKIQVNAFSFLFQINVKHRFLLQGCEDGMTLIADNPFIRKKELRPFEKGIRIDYILFKVSLV